MKCRNVILSPIYVEKAVKDMQFQKRSFSKVAHESLKKQTKQNTQFSVFEVK